MMVRPVDPVWAIGTRSAVQSLSKEDINRLKRIMQKGLHLLEKDREQTLRALQKHASPHHNLFGKREDNNALSQLLANLGRQKTRLDAIESAFDDMIKSV